MELDNMNEGMMKIAWDMETGDPDDFLTLLLFLGHPKVDLVSVTVTPGSREQVGLVQQVLERFDRPDIPVGAWRPDTKDEARALSLDPKAGKRHVSGWHYKAYDWLSPHFVMDDIESGWKVLERVLGPDTTLVTGGPLKNIGSLLREMAVRGGPKPNLGRIFVQGGFAGEGVVPLEWQLAKFAGKVTVPTYNLNGDPKSALLLLEKRMWFSDMRFVSKNVCHGVKYDRDMHTRFIGSMVGICGHTGWDQCECECHRNPHVMHMMACCHECPYCNQRVRTRLDLDTERRAEARSLIIDGMGGYLLRRPTGKVFHDPLAAMCAINPDIGEWAEVELYRDPKGGQWGSRPAEGSGVQVITGYDHEKFLAELLA